jgi:hypothetical protein
MACSTGLIARSTLSGALALALMAFTHAAAKDTDAETPAPPEGMRVQLNKITPVSDACRVYLVFENRTGRAFDAYTLDLVMFDTDDAILRRLAVEAGSMPEGKTRVKPFDLTGTKCEAVGKILLNEVMTCKGPDGAGSSSSCTAAARPESRLSDTPFIK